MPQWGISSFFLYSEYWPHPLSYGSFFTIYSPPYREGPGAGPSFGEVGGGYSSGSTFLIFQPRAATKQAMSGLSRLKKQ